MREDAAEIFDVDPVSCLEAMVPVHPKLHQQTGWVYNLVDYRVGVLLRACCENSYCIPGATLRKALFGEGP